MEEGITWLYGSALALHSGWRWIVLAELLAVITVLATGQAARRVSQATVAAIDVQLLVGLALYLFLSPFGAKALTAGRSGGDAVFFGAFHFVGMLVVVVLAHAGHILVKRGARRQALLSYAAALVLVAAATPWWRPLLRGFS